jgi:hypothetical protein
MGPLGSRQRQSLPLLQTVPLATPLVVGLRAEPLYGGCGTLGVASCSAKTALLLACGALSPVTAERPAR